MGQEISNSNIGLQKPFEQHESKIIELALKRKVILYEMVKAIEEIGQIILLAYALSGFKLEGNTEDDKKKEIAIMAGILYERMIDIFPEVTLEEFKESVKNGVMETYGAFHGLNVKTFIMFINGYLRSEERLYKLRKYKEEPAKEEPKQLTIGDYKKLVMDDYRLYKEGNHKLILFDEKRYMLLVKYIIPEESEIDWQGWLIKGRNYIEHTKTEKAKKTNDKSLLNQVALFAESFEKGEVTEKDFNAVQTAARKLRYFAYFDHCIKNNIDNIFNQE